MGMDDISKDYIQRVLQLTRGVVDSKGLDYNRLPGWLNGANVEIAHIDSTFLYLIKPSADETDDFDFIDEIQGDTELLLDFDNVDPYRHGLEFPDSEYLEGENGPTIIHGHLKEESSTVMQLDSPKTCLFLTRIGEYHSPVGVTNIYLQAVSNEQPIKTSFVPFALYVHDLEFQNIELHLKNVVKGIYTHGLESIYVSEIGDYYESQSKKQENAYSSRIDNSVIVLGAFDGNKRESELEQIRDFLNVQGFSASLIKYLPGHPARSITHKAKTYALSSKFCVIVDIEASGHLVEYAELKDEEIPIALLRKEGHGSSWMLGHEYQTDDYIELFEFNERPIEIMDEVIEWAEDFTEERIKGLEEFYPSWKD
jgi:hypothetical protein